jgi:hypothetical protein
MPRYFVFVSAPPYPSQGYYLHAKTYPQDPKKLQSNSEETNFYDSLPACMVDHVIVTADDIKEAKAIGLKQLFEQARRERV